MSYQYWSWLLTVVGVTGFILAGRKVWWCWYVNIACQGLWITYAIVTKQWGFIVASLVYTVVFAQNALKWTREHVQLRVVESGVRAGIWTPNEAREIYGNREWRGKLSTYKAEPPLTREELLKERERLIAEGVDPNELTPILYVTDEAEYGEKDLSKFYPEKE